MEDYDSTSLTKGCFVHKPAKPKKKSGSSTVPFKKTADLSLWKEIDSKIKDIEKKSYTETFDCILKFVNSCFGLSLQEITSVPAAVVVMGVNMSDHGNIFHMLEKHLHSGDVSGTVILESKKCQNISSTLQVIVTELMAKYEHILDIEDDLPKKQECSFEKLYSYYQSVVKKVQEVKFKVKSPKKKKKNFCENISKNIVLLIQDVENFNPDLLQELILICKIYAGKLPIILIFGMASAMVTLHNVLPQKALSCLEVETFHSVTPTDYLTQIIEEIVIAPHQPFKLGPKLFKLIIDTVLFHDFSISNLAYLLKFSMIEHFYNRRVSALCCHEHEIDDAVSKLSDEDLQLFKSLPSLKEYMENNPNCISSFSDKSTFKETIKILVRKLFLNQKVILILLKLLHCFVKDLPGYPLGKQLRELYSLSLEKEICLTPAYAEAQKLLKMQSQNNLMLKLRAGLDILESDKSVDESVDESVEDPLVIEHTKRMLRDYIERLSQLTADDFDKKSQDSVFLQSEKIISRHQLQEKIQSSIKQKRSNFEALRNEIMDDLLLQVFRNIRPPSRFPLYEVFYFDDVLLVKRSLMAVPRVTSCQSLNNPGHYLKCFCCQTQSPEEMHSSMPDICVLYKLHLESGKLINLCDWLQAFKSVKGDDSKISSRSKTKVKDTNDELNIRFLQAVSELQLLGFVKPTKRKTDHVARLTFGSF